MKKPRFDQDTYEADLALIMLESLVKKNVIGSNTYRAAKKHLEGGAERGCGESIITRVAQTAS